MMSRLPACKHENFSSQPTSGSVAVDILNTVCLATKMLVFLYTNNITYA